MDPHPWVNSLLPHDQQEVIIIEVLVHPHVAAGYHISIDVEGARQAALVSSWAAIGRAGIDSRAARQQAIRIDVT